MRSSHSSMLLVKSTSMYFSQYLTKYNKLYLIYQRYSIFASLLIANKFYIKVIYIMIIKKCHLYDKIHAYN